MKRCRCHVGAERTNVTNAFHVRRHPHPETARHDGVEPQVCDDAGEPQASVRGGQALRGPNRQRAQTAGVQAAAGRRHPGELACRQAVQHGQITLTGRHGLRLDVGLSAIM